MDVSQFNAGVRQNLIRNWAWNAVVNHSRIRKEFEEGRDLSATTLQVNKGVPAIVIGSGPSLDKVAPYLRGWQGAIFCSPSHVRILDRYECRPSFVVALDTSNDVAEKLRGPVYSDTTLLTHPSMDPDVFEFWKWSKRYFLMVENGEWSDLQPYMYPWIDAPLPNSGCVVNNSIHIATMLGYSPIFLMGVDMGFPAGIKAATNFRYRGAYAYWPVAPSTVDPKDELPQENGIPTTHTQLFYKAILLANWKLLRSFLISCSDGILTEIPYAEPLEVLKKQGQGYGGLKTTDKQIDTIVDSYTIPRGMYSVRGPHGPMGNELAGQIQEQIRQMEGVLEERKRVFAKWRHGEDGWARDTSE